MELNKRGITRSSIFLHATASGFARAAPLVASICWLAACAPEESAESTVDDGTPAPYQFAEAEVRPVAGSGVGGLVRFDQNDEFLEIEGRITGLTAGAYGLRVHEARDCATVDAGSAGPVFSAGRASPDLALDPDLPNEAGNLGDIVAGGSGTATFEFVDTELSLGTGERSIVGRTLVVHAAVEDIGPDGLPVLAGPPLGCAEIEPILTPTYVP